MCCEVLHSGLCWYELLKLCVVQVADKRMAQLQASLETADREKEELQQALEGLRQQVTRLSPSPNLSH